jgi:hypothetical protein
LEQPILPPSGDGPKSRWTANPDLIEFLGRQILLYRGSGTWPGRDGLHDRLLAAEVLEIGPGRLRINDLNGGAPIVDIGAEGEFDGEDVLDPAGIVFEGKLFVYYSAIGEGPDSIGLAVSADGERFEKVGKVLTGRAPEVILKDGKVFMIYQLPDEAGNYVIHLASSEDGVAFLPEGAEAIFPRQPGSWDSLSLVTARLSEEAGVYYMIYGGSSYLADEPDYFGIARSKDLVRWEPHPGNPVFGCGRKGAADGGAMWFPALCETEDAFVMLYEGSRGKYSWDLSSTICMAWVRKAG